MRANFSEIQYNGQKAEGCCCSTKGLEENPVWMSAEQIPVKGA